MYCGYYSAITLWFVTEKQTQQKEANVNEVCQTYRNNYISALLRHRNSEDGPENHGAYIHRREEQGPPYACTPTNVYRRRRGAENSRTAAVGNTRTPSCTISLGATT